MQVYTSVGLVDRDLLTVRDVVTEEDNARVTATEWFLDGALVRRDVNVNILRGLSLGAEQSEIR